MYGKLKAGGSVNLPDGRTIEGHMLVGPPRKGRKIALSGDTLPIPIVEEMAQQADLLIHEATYLHSEREHALRGYHSTAEAAAKTALQAQVKQLVLNHFSARYETAIQLQALLNEARAIFPETILATDFLIVEVLRGEAAARDKTNSCLTSKS